MSESFRRALGRKVVSRATAHEMGAVSQLLVTVDCAQVAAIILGRGKKSQFIDWAQVTGFGADAVMVSEESALRAPADDRERAAATGKLGLLGKRTLSELGDELGIVVDVTFDPQTGTIETLQVDERPLPAEAVQGCGSYAVVFSANEDRQVSSS